MSIYTHIKSFVASASVLVCASVLAETPETLVEQALQRNPELNFFVAEIAAAKGALRTAGTVRNPEFNSDVGYKNSRESSGGMSGSGAVVSLSISQPIEYPGRVALRKAIANHDLAIAELHLQQFRLTLAARVRSLAYASTSAQERTRAVQGIASRTQALNDVLKERPLAWSRTATRGTDYQRQFARLPAAGTRIDIGRENDCDRVESVVRTVCRCGVNGKRWAGRFYRAVRTEAG